MVEHKAHRCGIRIRRVCAWNTSKLAYGGSGPVARDTENYSMCTFKTGKRHECDLSASYNIGSRYFLREYEKSIPATEWRRISAKVPECAHRIPRTLNTLIRVCAELHWLTYGEHASGRDEVVIRPRPESSETIGLSLTADSAKRTFGTEANKLSLFTQESDDMAPTIRSGSLVVINHTINKVIGSGVYLVQVGETKELRRIQPLVDGTLDIRIDNPKRFANEIATDDKIVILGKVLSTVSVKHIR